MGAAYLAFVPRGRDCARALRPKFVHHRNGSEGCNRGLAGTRPGSTAFGHRPRCVMNWLCPFIERAIGQRRGRGLAEC